MLIVIDGYNLLKRILKKEYSSKYLRDKLINLLLKYCKVKQHKIIIVFDSGDSIYKVKKEIDNSLVVVYSGFQIDADTYIKEFIDEKIEQFIVVSSDRQISSYAIEKNKISINVDIFIYYLNRFKAQHISKVIIKNRLDNIFKISNDNNQELDNLIYENLEDKKNFDFNLKFKNYSYSKDNNISNNILDIIDKKL